MLKCGDDDHRIKKQPSITFTEQGAFVQVDICDDQMIFGESTKLNYRLAMISYTIVFLHSDEDEKDQPSWTCDAPKLSNILALLIKNWITMKRNPVLLIFIFFLPGIFMVLTCISIGIDPVDLPVGVVNYETNCTGVNLNVSKISL